MTAATTTKKKEPGGLARYLPILNWLPKYDKSWLTGDLIAGLSVWALTVPTSMGYAAIAGVPVQYGLYAAAMGLIAFALFTGSRGGSPGPVPPRRPWWAPPCSLSPRQALTRPLRCPPPSPCRRPDLCPHVRLQDGLDLPVPLPERADRLYLWRGHQRRHRPTGQDHRDGSLGRERLAKADQLDRQPARDRPDHPGGGRGCPGAPVSGSRSLRPRCRERWWPLSWASWPRWSLAWATPAWP